MVRPSDLQSATPSSFANGFDCIENLKEFDYLRRELFRLKKIQCFAFRNLPFRLARMDKVVSARLLIDCAI